MDTYIKFKDGVVLNPEMKATAVYLSKEEYKEDLKNIKKQLKNVYDELKKTISNNEELLVKVPLQDFYFIQYDELAIDANNMAYLIPSNSKYPELTWKQYGEYFKLIMDYTEEFTKLVKKMEDIGIMYLIDKIDDAESLINFTQSLKRLVEWYKHTRFMQYGYNVADLRALVNDPS